MTLTFCIFTAPEILTLDPISLAADIWSLGVVAYVLLTGFSPFGGDTDQVRIYNFYNLVLFINYVMN